MLDECQREGREGGRIKVTRKTNILDFKLMFDLHSSTGDTLLASQLRMLKIFSFS